GYIALMFVACIAVFVWTVRSPASNRSPLTPASILAPSPGADKADDAAAETGRSVADVSIAAPKIPPTAIATAAAPVPATAVATATAGALTLANATLPSSPSPSPVATSSVVLSQGAAAFALGDARGLTSDPVGALSL